MRVRLARTAAGMIVLAGLGLSGIGPAGAAPPAGPLGTLDAAGTTNSATNSAADSGTASGPTCTSTSDTSDTTGSSSSDTTGTEASGSAAGAQGGSATGSATPVLTDDPVSIRLGSVTPSGLSSRTDLVVKGTLHNPGPAIEDIRLRLRLNRNRLESRAMIDSWMLDDGSVQIPGGSGVPMPGGRKLEQIPAGATIPFTLTVPAGRTGLGDESWKFGARGLMVQLSGPDGDLATQRTLVVWSPPGVTTTTRLSLLTPLTADVPSTDAGAPSQASADLLTPNGRLRHVLDATSDPAFDWAVDPAVLESVRSLTQTGVEATPTPSDDDDAGAAASDPPASGAGSGGSSSPSAGSSVTPQDRQETDARSWLAKLKGGLDDRVVLGLPYADPDLNSILNNGQSPLLRTSDQLGKQITKEVLGTSLDRSVAWPGDGKISGKAVAGLDRAGRNDVLIAAGNQPPADDVDYTPTGRSSLKAKDHKLGGLLYDEQLSALLAASGGPTSVVCTQWILAELAAIGMERPDVTTHVLAVAPRTWNPEPARVEALAGALHTASWVNLRNIDSLRQQSGNATDRALPEYSSGSHLAELPVGQMTAAARLNDGLNILGTVAVDPGPSFVQLRERVASLLSISWRGRNEELYNARRDVSKVVNPITGGVHLLTGSSKLFLAKSQVIPVYVENETPFKVKLRVRLTPRSGQLTFAGPQSIEIDPGGRTTASIETKAVAGGNVDVEARLLNAKGQQLGATSVFTVRVRPDWEAWGLIGTAAILGLLLVAGVLRGIRRDRTRVPPELVPDVDDIAAQSEPGARTAPATKPQGVTQPKEQDPAEPSQSDQSAQPGSSAESDREPAHAIASEKQQ